MEKGNKNLKKKGLVDNGDGDPIETKSVKDKKPGEEDTESSWTNSGKLMFFPFLNN